MTNHTSSSSSTLTPKRTVLRGRPHTTRQVAGWFGVSVDEVRRWIHGKAYFRGGRYWVVLKQMIGVHRPGRPWRFYMKAHRRGTSRPPSSR